MLLFALKNAQLWRESHALSLRPKAFTVLRYLAEHPHKRIRRDELVQKAEARRMLSDIDNWLTEGFDTADLKEAKALLASLA